MVALNKLPEMVRNTWRDLTWESEEIPEQGMDHAVMMLRGVSSTEHELEHLLPESLVLRVPHEPEYRAQAPLESALIAQLFRGSSVRVPETVRQAYARGTFNTPNPVMLTLNTEVDGEELTPQLWASLTPAQRTLAAEQLGSLLASMHSMDPDLLPVSKVENWWTDGAETQQLSTAARTLPAKHELMRQRVAEFVAPKISDEEYQHIQTVFGRIDMLLARPGQQRCLTHGDLFAEHLLWQSAAGAQRSTYAQGYERSGIGVIDFSDMTVGDPAVDYMHFGAIDPALPRMVLAAAEDSFAEKHDGELYTVPDILTRAEIYKQWDDIFLLIDHFRTGRSPRIELKPDR